MDGTRIPSLQSEGNMCPIYAVANVGNGIFSCHPYVLMAAIGFVYQQILREALRIKRQINKAMPGSVEGNTNNAHQSQTDTDATRMRDNINVIKNFAIIVGTSFLVWLPHAMVSSYLCYQPLTSLYQTRLAIWIAVMALVSAMIPVLNPIIYATRLKWFRVLMRYVIGSISYRECEQSMSNIWFLISGADKLSTVLSDVVWLVRAHHIKCVKCFCTLHCYGYIISSFWFVLYTDACSTLGEFHWHW